MLKTCCNPSTVLRVLKRSFHVAKLDTRGLIAISGADANAFLQGLITNDINLLAEQKEPVSAIYSLMLNVQGRVINDFVVYHVKSKTVAFPAGGYLLDTDSILISQTIALFKKYRLRRKLEISDVSERYYQFCLWNFDTDQKASQQPSSEQAFFLKNDPRFASLGKRLLVPKDDADSTISQISSRMKEKFAPCSQEQWKFQRYRFAVPEGATELPPGKCLPLESNCDFLNGVSFSKGCYIGQELTARTHNIGVTRKRLLPITFEEPQICVAPDTKLYFESDGNLKPAGEIRIVTGKHGLGLVRIQSIDPTTKSARLYMIEEKSKSKHVCHVHWPEEFPPLKDILVKIA